MSKRSTPTQTSLISSVTDKVVLGIDPGSHSMGFGLIVQNDKNQYHHQHSGCIQAKGSTLSDRLLNLYDTLSNLVDTYKPHAVAIEQVFVKYASSALKLGQARGVAIIGAVKQGVPLAEYAPREIKQAVVGYGAADKSQIQQMVKALLRLKTLPNVDEADALAVAICHLNSLAWQQKIRAQDNTK